MVRNIEVENESGFYIVVKILEFAFILWYSFEIHLSVFRKTDTTGLADMGGILLLVPIL